MDVDRFTRDRTAGWEELAELVRAAGSKPQRLGAEALLRLGRRYRAAAADLALARRLFPGQPVTRRLERLVTEARQSVYATEARRRSIRGFLATGYWQRVRERPLLLALGLALLFVPLALAAVWALDDPAAALGIVPAEFQGAAEPGAGPGDLAQVTFLAVAGGILLGLGSAALTIFNGGFIGAIVGLTIENGSIGELLRFVLPHGLLELSCIAVSCMAGLRLGWAIVDPGPLTRGASLRREARAAMEIVLGTMPWLVLAGVIEGFVSPRHPPLPVAAAVGIAAAGAYWALLLWRGGHARPRVLARR
jgi:Stage II sporulation protein M